MIDWFATSHVENLAATCRRGIRGFYAHCARLQGKEGARWFAEKARPDHHPRIVRELMHGTREIVLVRDFRDMVSSILAFNAQRGVVGFDRNYAGTDEEYPSVLSGAVRALAAVPEKRPDALVVRYEDLINAPGATLAALLDHLGLPCEASDVQRLLDGATYRAEISQAQHRTMLDAAESIGRWRRDLDPAVARACDEAFGPALARFGYA
jgi:hypothetical protein